MSVVTPDLIKQVAALARLRLEGDALAKFSTQLDDILQYVQKLQAVNTDQVEPTSHVLPLSNVLREDAPHQCLSQEAAAAMAPAAHPPFVKVPKVIE